ncbi:ATP synthase F1 subunit delta [Leeuwenhoekiella marinoflava]|uniref:ATP synthase subunit delta n=2 Tax=Leeuwenhoekiella marinoflava TaxID=988 RepID=A0A4Q0PRP9_9FLAO|nr:ATP synthase F1 subunit delta [Leeuwenhoekiella marinoflava]RXG32932.1 ATP synthase F1 subcomplex delta subunit [Leeuwenhoekiella marinoflava]SHE32428.1 ATP synthase F1 subcomplex delta subunit [Leeuwenhoekiella marinoflava DSM 3653]
MSSRAAIRYAKAILDQAQDKGTEEVVFGNMKSIDATLSASKELRSVLKSPVIKAEDKRASLKAIFEGYDPSTLSLIELLVDKKRTSLLGQVAKSYLDLYNASKGIIVAHVTTAVELDSSLESKVLAKVKELTNSTEVTLEHHIDPSIIGGFILRVGDVQYDASIDNQLASVQKEFSKRL